MYSTHNPELHPPRLCKKTGLMHNARPDEHTTTSRPNAQAVKKDVPQTHANAGTRPRARNQAENRLVSFVDSPPRPPSTRRLGGDLFSLPATQITSAANQTRNLASFLLCSAELWSPGTNVSPMRMYRADCTDGGWTTSLVYKYHTCREDSSSSPPQPVRDGYFQQPDVHMLSAEVDMSARSESRKFSPAAWPSNIAIQSSWCIGEQSRRLDPIPCALYLGSGRHDRPQISRNLLRLGRDG